MVPVLVYMIKIAWLVVATIGLAEVAIIVRICIIIRIGMIINS